MGIQGVTNDKVIFNMMTNVTTIFMREFGMKSLSLEIQIDISIPWVRCADKKQQFIRKIIDGLSIFNNMVKITYKIDKNQ